MCLYFFSKHDLEFQIIDFVFTDGAPAMLSNKNNLHLQGTHCILNLHAFISKTLP